MTVGAVLGEVPLVNDENETFAGLGRSAGDVRVLGDRRFALIESDQRGLDRCIERCRHRAH